ncbi:MAG TPA: hemerythrin domain-containing protein [Kofleriaceae bacterium]
MKLLPSKLEHLARKAKAHAPAAARGFWERLETAYQARRGKQPPAASAPPPNPPAPVEVVAPKQRPINWELRSQPELVDHIEQHYHAGLRRDLPRLIAAAQTIEREHTAHAAVPRGLSDLLTEFYGSLDSHMMKEERMLFPRLRTNARGGELDMPMRMMEREHDDHAEDLEKIRALTHDLTAPADATPAWAALYTDLATLESELRQHIYLENNVLFARASGGAEY